MYLFSRLRDLSDSIETESLLIFMPFGFSAEQNQTNRVDLVRLVRSSLINQTHRKGPVRSCPNQSNNGSIEFD